MTNIKSSTKPDKQSKFTIITDNTELSKLIKSIDVRGKGIDKDLHRAAVSALAHGFMHGSTAHAESFLAAMPKSSRAKALRVYLLDMGCFLVKEDGKTLGINKDLKAAGFVKEAEAIATPFYEYTKEVQAPSQVAAMDMVRNLIKRLESANSKGLLDDSSVLSKLRAVAPAIVPAEAPAVNSGVAELDI